MLWLTVCVFMSTIISVATKGLYRMFLQQAEGQTYQFAVFTV